MGLTFKVQLSGSDINRTTDTRANNKFFAFFYCPSRAFILLSAFSIFQDVKNMNNFKICPPPGADLTYGLTTTHILSAYLYGR
jgi:hypothetical protein